VLSNGKKQVAELYMVRPAYGSFVVLKQLLLNNSSPDPMYLSFLTNILKKFILFQNYSTVSQFP